MSEMREHQIIINLKKDQFEEVQRLARLAGSKSPSVYLRDRMLAFLGIEGEALAEAGTDGSTTKKGPESASDIQRVRSELARMHNELQAFIAESLSAGRYLDEDFEDGENIEESYPAYAEVERLLEEDIRIYNAGLQFQESKLREPILSGTREQPPLSADEEADLHSANVSREAIQEVNQETIQQEETVSTPEVSISPEDKSELPEEATVAGQDLPEREENPSPSDESSGRFYSSGAPWSIFDQGDVDKSGYGIFDRRNEQLENSGVFLGPDTIEAASIPTAAGMPNETTQLMQRFDKLDDELEDLAERAFAISPRLGVSESPIDKSENDQGQTRRTSNQPLASNDQSDDPLASLLDDDLVRHMENPPVEELQEIEESGFPAQNIPPQPESAPSPPPETDGSIALQQEDEEVQPIVEEQEPEDISETQAIEDHALSEEEQDALKLTQFQFEQTSTESEESTPDTNTAANQPHSESDTQSDEVAPEQLQKPTFHPPRKRKEDDDDDVSGGPPPKRRRR